MILASPHTYAQIHADKAGRSQRVTHARNARENLSLDGVRVPGGNEREKESEDSFIGLYGAALVKLSGSRGFPGLFLFRFAAAGKSFAAALPHRLSRSRAILCELHAAPVLDKVRPGVIIAQFAVMRFMYDARGSGVH